MDGFYCFDLLSFLKPNSILKAYQLQEYQWFCQGLSTSSLPLLTVTLEVQVRGRVQREKYVEESRWLWMESPEDKGLILSHFYCML